MLVFLVFLGVMAVLLFALPDKDYSPNEKRYLASAPEVTVEGILSGKTQEDLEKYTADQIPGRDFYVGVNAYWNLATGRNAAQDIYYCDGGYLINAPKAMNETVFTNNLTKFDQFAAQLGVPADLIMVPSTGYLMEEVLPTFHGAYDDDQLYDLASQQLQTVRLIDVREDLKEGKETGQICYRTDHHLTSYGNYLLYRSYQIAQGAPYLSRDAYEVASYDGFYGTTWSGSGYWGVAPGQRHPAHRDPDRWRDGTPGVRQPLLPLPLGGDGQVPRLPGRQPQLGDHPQSCGRRQRQRPGDPGLLCPLLQHLPGGQL